jgi:hypothetical protein
MVVTNNPAVTDAAPALGESAHDKAMLAAVDSANAQANPAAAPAAPAKPERPADVPEKFWDADKGVVKTEELLKSYRELETNKSKPAAAPAAKPAEGTTPPAEGDAAAAAAAAGADTSKVNFAGLQSEYAEKGALSDESYKALEAVGLGREAVDGWIAGQEALAQKAITEAHTAVGGKETFDSMLQWAGANLNADERAAFDSAVVGNPAQRSMAISSLHARYTAAVGNDPKLVRGGGSSEAGAFQSRDEVVRAMSDPRYAKDTAYRAEVERKLANSTVF